MLNTDYEGNKSVSAKPIWQQSSWTVLVKELPWFHFFSKALLFSSHFLCYYKLLSIFQNKLPLRNHWALQDQFSENPKQWQSLNGFYHHEIQIYVSNLLENNSPPTSSRFTFIRGKKRWASIDRDGWCTGDLL